MNNRTIFINSRLHPILVDQRYATKNWIWTLGEPWLQLTRGRFDRLTKMLGRDDVRIKKLLLVMLFGEAKALGGINRLPKVEEDKKLDREARERILFMDPSAFDDGVLSPNWKINNSRRLDRDWDCAINSILIGQSYRDVSKQHNCSVGLLHRKVKEHTNHMYN